MRRAWQTGLFPVYGLLAITLLLQSCVLKDKKHRDEAGPDTVYFDYRINAEEGDDNLTILLQYRGEDEEGDAIAISGLGRVTLDGEELPADSTRRTGFFYETHKPIISFTGKHSIVFTSVSGKIYKEEFSFRPVVLLTPVGDTALKEEWVFAFEGLDEEDYLRVLLTDTSFAHEGINRVDTVRKGRLVIPAADVETLSGGPVQLQFIREYERPLENAGESGGRLHISYSIRRHFFLKDNPDK